MLPIEDDEMFLNREILLLFLGAGLVVGTDDDDVDKIVATSGVVVVVVVYSVGALCAKLRCTERPRPSATWAT